MVAGYCEYVAVHVMTQFHVISFWVTVMIQVCKTRKLMQNDSVTPPTDSTHFYVWQVLLVRCL